MCKWLCSCMAEIVSSKKSERRDACEGVLSPSLGSCQDCLRRNMTSCLRPLPLSLDRVLLCCKECPFPLTLKPEELHRYVKPIESVSNDFFGSSICWPSALQELVDPKSKPAQRLQALLGVSVFNTLATLAQLLNEEDVALRLKRRREFLSKDEDDVERDLAIASAFSSRLAGLSGEVANDGNPVGLHSFAVADFAPEVPAVHRVEKPAISLLEDEPSLESVAPSNTQVLKRKTVIVDIDDVDDSVGKTSDTLLNTRSVAASSNSQGQSGALFLEADGQTSSRIQQNEAGPAVANDIPFDAFSVSNSKERSCGRTIVTDIDKEQKGSVEAKAKLCNPRSAATHSSEGRSENFTEPVGITKSGITRIDAGSVVPDTTPGDVVAVGKSEASPHETVNTFGIEEEESDVENDSHPQTKLANTRSQKVASPQGRSDYARREQENVKKAVDGVQSFLDLVRAQTIPEEVPSIAKGPIEPAASVARSDSRKSKETERSSSKRKLKKAVSLPGLVPLFEEVFSKSLRFDGELFDHALDRLFVKHAVSEFFQFTMKGKCSCGQELNEERAHCLSFVERKARWSLERIESSRFKCPSCPRRKKVTFSFCKRMPRFLMYSLAEGFPKSWAHLSPMFNGVRYQLQCFAMENKENKKPVFYFRRCGVKWTKIERNKPDEVVSFYPRIPTLDVRMLVFESIGEEVKTTRSSDSLSSAEPSPKKRSVETCADPAREGLLLFYRSADQNTHPKHAKVTASPVDVGKDLLLNSRFAAESVSMHLTSPVCQQSTPSLQQEQAAMRDSKWVRPTMDKVFVRSCKTLDEESIRGLSRDVLDGRTQLLTSETVRKKARVSIPSDLAFPGYGYEKKADPIESLTHLLSRKNREVSESKRSHSGKSSRADSPASFTGKHRTRTVSRSSSVSSWQQGPTPGAKQIGVVPSPATMASSSQQPTGNDVALSGGTLASFEHDLPEMSATASSSGTRTTTGGYDGVTQLSSQSIWQSTDLQQIPGSEPLDFFSGGLMEIDSLETFGFANDDGFSLSSQWNGFGNC